MFSASFYDRISFATIEFTRESFMKVKSEKFFMALSKVIYQERKKQKLTQAELAKKSGLNRTYVSDIERGKVNPTLNVLLQISEALSLSPAVLMLKVEFELEKGDLL